MSRVTSKDGLPLWLWSCVLLLCIAVAVGLVNSVASSTPEQLYREGLRLIEAGDKREYTAVIDTLKRHENASEFALMLKGLAAAKEGRDPRAVELLSQAAQKTMLRPLALQQAAHSLERMGRHHEAVDSYNESIALATEESLETRWMLAEMYNSLGAVLLAESQLSEILSEEPDNVRALRLRANVYKNMERYPAAVSDLAVIMDLPSGMADARSFELTEYLQCLLKADDTRRIKHVVHQYLDLIVDDELKASLLIAAGEFSRAKVLLVNARAIEENHRRIQPGLAIIAAQIAIHEDTPSQAILASMEAIGGHPRDIDTYRVAVKALELAKDDDRLNVARQNLRQLNQLHEELIATIQKMGDNIDDVDGRLRVRYLLTQLGRERDSQKWYHAAELLDPEHTVRSSDGVTQPEDDLKPLVGFQTQ